MTNLDVGRQRRRGVTCSPGNQGNLPHARETQRRTGGIGGGECIGRRRSRVQRQFPEAVEGLRVQAEAAPGEAQNVGVQRRV